MWRNRAGLSRAFTLVELLVVLAIIGVLLAILIPAVNAARGAARRQGCANNMRQIGLGLANFESARGQFPEGQTWVSRSEPNNYPYAWSALLLGFIEQQAVFDQLDRSRPFLAPQNLVVASTVIPTYLCPSTARREAHRNASEQLFNLGTQPGEGLACMDYLGIAGPSPDSANPATGELYGSQRGILIGTKGLPQGDQIKTPRPVRVRSVTDGMSFTACVTECTGRGLDNDGDYHGTWVSGRNISHMAKGVNSSKPPKVWSKERVFSEHAGGALFLMCDGSAHFLEAGTDKLVLKAISSRDGAEGLEREVL